MADIRPIEPSSPTLPIEQTHFQQRPIDLFEHSSLEKAKAVDPTFTPTKPQLDPPTNPIFQTIDHLNRRAEPIFDQWMRIKERGIEQEFDSIHQMHIDQARKMEEALEASKAVSFWGVLDDMTSTFSAATSFFFGSSAIAAGSSVVGGALIASGVLSIGNLAFKYANVWDKAADSLAGENKELGDTLRSYLPGAVGLAATALSAYGAYGAWKFATQTGTQITNSLLTTATQIAGSCVTLQNGLKNADHTWKLADLKVLQSSADISRLVLDELVDDTQEFHQRETSIHETIGKILEERDQMIQMVQQPV